METRCLWPRPGIPLEEMRRYGCRILIPTNASHGTTGYGRGRPTKHALRCVGCEALIGIHGHGVVSVRCVVLSRGISYHATDEWECEYGAIVSSAEVVEHGAGHGDIVTWSIYYPVAAPCIIWKGRRL